MRGLQVKGLALGALTADFEVAAGECVALRGPSGSGKTRVLRAIADLDPVDGDVCSGEVARDQVDAPVWRKRVVYVAAEPGWWSDHVAQHFQAWPPSDLLGLDADIGGKPLAQLSTGERQRLALLRALEVQPDVLLLDEPTSALDRPATLAVEAMLLRRLESGLAILWATHDEAQVRRVASRALHIDACALREESW